MGRRKKSKVVSQDTTTSPNSASQASPPPPQDGVASQASSPSPVGVASQANVTSQASVTSQDTTNSQDSVQLATMVERLILCSPKAPVVREESRSPSSDRPSSISSSAKLSLTERAEFGQLENAQQTLSNEQSPLASAAEPASPGVVSVATTPTASPVRGSAGAASPKFGAAVPGSPTTLTATESASPVCVEEQDKFTLYVFNDQGQVEVLQEDATSIPEEHIHFLTTQWAATKQISGQVVLATKNGLGTTTQLVGKIAKDVFTAVDPIAREALTRFCEDGIPVAREGALVAVQATGQLCAVSKPLLKILWEQGVPLLRKGGEQAASAAGTVLSTALDISLEVIVQVGQIATEGAREVQQQLRR